MYNSNALIYQGGRNILRGWARAHHVMGRVRHKLQLGTRHNTNQTGPRQHHALSGTINNGENGDQSGLIIPGSPYEDTSSGRGKGSNQHNQSVARDSKMGHHGASVFSWNATMHVRPSSTIFSNIGTISVHGGQKYGPDSATQVDENTSVPAAAVYELSVEKYRGT